MVFLQLSQKQNKLLTIQFSVRQNHHNTFQKNILAPRSPGMKTTALLLPFCSKTEPESVGIGLLQQECAGWMGTERRTWCFLSHSFSTRVHLYISTFVHLKVTTFELVIFSIPILCSTTEIPGKKD